MGDFQQFISELKECRACSRLVESRTNVVVYEGSAKPDVVFVGEAPGRNEDAEGVPFVGRAGAVLREHIEKYLVPRNISYGITNLVKCRPVIPPNRNGKPTQDEIAMCTVLWLHREIRLLSPTLVVLLGDYALRGIAGHTGISKWRGRAFCVPKNGWDVFPTWHPAALVYDRNKRTGFEEDFQAISRFIEAKREGLEGELKRGHRIPGELASG